LEDTTDYHKIKDTILENFNTGVAEYHKNGLMDRHLQLCHASEQFARGTKPLCTAANVSTFDELMDLDLKEQSE